ncbi:MAG: lytic transglycosylase domain-containing protein [Gemmatimonadetes bacterium]|nr:lytic transglycosylase domain-containing protein [Gemmatimonadota bacterium]
MPAAPPEHPFAGPARLPVWLWFLFILAGALALALASLDGKPARPLPESSYVKEAQALTDLEQRADALEREAFMLHTTYTDEVAPLKRQLMRNGADDGFVTRIAIALVREGRREKLDPTLLASIVLVEDPMLDPEVLSPVGAVGLMQVMPLHAGGWGCGSPDLTNPDVNICHGVRILAHDLRLTKGDLDRALLRYNGCVKGANTPDCHLYPLWVQRQVRLAYREPGRSDERGFPAVQ